VAWVTGADGRVMGLDADATRGVGATSRARLDSCPHEVTPAGIGMTASTARVATGREPGTHPLAADGWPIPASGG